MNSLNVPHLFLKYKSIKIPLTCSELIICCKILENWI